MFLDGKTASNKHRTTLLSYSYEIKYRRTAYSDDQVYHFKLATLNMWKHVEGEWIAFMKNVVGLGLFTKVITITNKMEASFRGSPISRGEGRGPEFF